MITNASNTQAICSLGWVHKGGLWVYRLEDASPQVTKLSDARYLTVKEGKNDFFSVVHHHDHDIAKLEISAHHHAEPLRPVSSISISRLDRSGYAEFEVTGDRSVWKQLPGAYVASAFGDFRLFLVHPDASLSVQTFPWYTDKAYDQMYQGIVGVEQVPNTNFLIVSIQRDSNPILYDPDGKTVIRKLRLADRGGSPKFKHRISASEYWAQDYDHLVKLNASTLEVVEAKYLQEAAAGWSRQFIGEFSFCRAETLCLVARPFSGDVLGLNCDNMRPTYRAALGRQPLEAALLDSKLVAVDWKTGEFLSGSLENI